MFLYMWEFVSKFSIKDSWIVIAGQDKGIDIVISGELGHLHNSRV
jgi:hypothetical protein